MTAAFTRVLPADAPRDRWLTARKTGIGSSDIAGVLGQSTWASPYAIWWDKVRPDLDTDDAGSEQMRWGQLLEPTIAAEWSVRTGIPVRRCGLVRSTTRHWQIASPDRLTADGGVLEVKCASGWDHDQWDADTIPLKYLLQTTHLMDVLGADHGHVAVLLGGNELRLFDVPLDQEIVGIVRDRGAAFWEQVTSRTPPPTDAHTATTAALKDRWATASGESVVLHSRWLARLDERETAKDDIAALDTRCAAIDNELRDAMGEATEAVSGGLGVASWRPRKDGVRVLKVTPAAKRKELAL